MEYHKKTNKVVQSSKPGPFNDPCAEILDGALIEDLYFFNLRDTYCYCDDFELYYKGNRICVVSPWCSGCPGEFCEGSRDKTRINTAPLCTKPGYVRPVIDESKWRDLNDTTFAEILDLMAKSILN